MNPGLMAEIATLRQSELLREAETRRLRAASLPHTKNDDQRAIRAVPRWRRTLMAMFRPATEPCCA